MTVIQQNLIADAKSKKKYVIMIDALVTSAFLLFLEFVAVMTTSWLNYANIFHRWIQISYPGSK